MSQAIDHLVRRAITNAVGDLEARNVDLARVSLIDPGTRALGVGDVRHDGHLTVSRDDTVAVWAGGVDVATATIPGAWEHYAAGLPEAWRR